MNIKKIPILLFFVLFLAVKSFAADHYASPTGSASWANSTSIEQPCSLETARTNANAGDTVYLRGGTYTISSTWQTVNAGSGDDDSQRIIFKAYTGETPEFVSSGLGNTIEVEDSYWTFDGITFTASNMTDHDHGIIRVGDNSTASYLKIVNCTVELVSSAGHDNIACISLQANRCNGAYIYNNRIIGVEPGSDYNCGIQYLGGGAVGVKILNNEISYCRLGITVKHANGDASIGAAQIKYNWIHDCTYGIYGQPTYITIENNITNFILLGDNGGGANSLFNHNTVYPTSGIELWSPSEGPVEDCTFTNNIFPTKTTYGSTEALNTWDYNMYGDDAAIGAHDIGTSSPTFVGGASPSTIAGFALTSESAGYQACADGSDMGADVSLVGVNAGEASSTAPRFSGMTFRGMGQ